MWTDEILFKSDFAHKYQLQSFETTDPKWQNNIVETLYSLECDVVLLTQCFELVHNAHNNNIITTSLNALCSVHSTDNNVPLWDQVRP